MSKLVKLYTSNLCGLLYANYISIKIFLTVSIHMETEAMGGAEIAEQLYTDSEGLRKDN